MVALLLTGPHLDQGGCQCRASVGSVPSSPMDAEPCDKMARVMAKAR